MKEIKPGPLTLKRGRYRMHIERHNNGPRLWIGKRRLHHFHAGLAAIATGLVVGAVLIARDLDDFLEWCMH